MPEKAGKAVPTEAGDWEEYKLKAAEGCCGEIPCPLSPGTWCHAKLVPSTRLLTQGCQQA